MCYGAICGLSTGMQCLSHDTRSPVGWRNGCGDGCWLRVMTCGSEGRKRLEDGWAVGVQAPLGQALVGSLDASRISRFFSLTGVGGVGLRGGNFSPWDISQRVYFACSPEFASGNFAPTCCEPTFGWWRLLYLLMLCH